MLEVIICVLIALGYMLIIFKKIKLNFKTIFFLLLSIVSFTYLINDYYTVNYVQIETDEQIKTIWVTYANKMLSQDVQLTRTLHPDKSSDGGTYPNQVISDNKYIYSISFNKVIITSIAELEVIKELDYRESFKPLFIYVTSDKLIVIGEENNNTYCFIYNKDNYELFKKLSIHATFITSRIINDELYIISSKLIDSKSQDRPQYSEDDINKYLPYNEIFYIEGTYPNNYVNITKTNINTRKELDIISYLGLGQVIYQSKNYIYIAEEKYDEKTGNANKTILIKIKNKDLSLVNLQEVPGYILDSHSLSEYKGFLRIATTTNATKDKKEANNIYILNDRLRIIGRLENFSVGSKLQAAIFINEKAYIETFNILNQLYCIDLSNLRMPRIISEIKFDGYNTNFVPYGREQIIAFGLVLDNEKSAIGLKVTLYNIANPRKVEINSENTIMYKDYNNAFTEVLYDGKALLVDFNNGIIGFPIVYWIKESEKATYYKQFFTVYNIKNNELINIGKISHYEKSTKSSIGDDIKRGIIIGHDIYTVSDRLIKVNTIDDLRLIRDRRL